MSATIWNQWTNESAENIHNEGFDQLSANVQDLWATFTVDERGARYPEYENRTPHAVAVQMWDEICEEIEGKNEI